MRYLSILLLLLVSCTTIQHRMEVGCQKSGEEIISQATGVLMDEGFEIKTVGATYLTAATVPDYNFVSQCMENYWWSIRIKGSKILASAGKRLVKENRFGKVLSNRTLTYGDELSKNQGWYWNVRQELEALCGQRVVVLTKEVPMQAY